MSLQAYQDARAQSSGVGATIVQKVNSGAPTKSVKVDLVDITEKASRWGDRSTITLTSSRLQAKEEDDRYGDYAVILRRKVSEIDKPVSTTLEIKSAVIRNGLRQVIGDYPFVNTRSGTIEIPRPYIPLFHFRTALRDYASDACRTPTEAQHMQVLIKFMKLNLQETEKEYERLLPSNMISYRILWAIFSPETVIVAQGDRYEECFVVESFWVQQTSTGSAFMIEARSWDYNGARFGPKTTTLSIAEFTGNRKITSLSVYPISFAQESDANTMRQRLIERGHKWKGLLKVSHREYNAIAWSDPLTHRREAYLMADLIPIHTTGRIIVDYETHAQANPNLATKLVKSGATAMDKDQAHEVLENTETLKAKKWQEDKYLSHADDDSYIMSDEQALLCPAQIRGFSLAEKVWAFFLVEKVREIEWTKDAFERLELAHSLKEIIQALVVMHGQENTHSERFDDIITGKGKGLIFLLSGPPGLGKTLTAETIAEHTRKPLYSVTSGELGTESGQTDQKLRRIFTRAKTWGAILLLDEADVFLAKRNSSDLHRNAFVSIFLKLIEYYQGTLFLTTNRVSDFDEAFQSRIHLTITYKPLDDERRAIIWRNLLPNPEAWDEEQLVWLGKSFQINGREIKNLIKTSLALANFQKSPLSEKHILCVHRHNQDALNTSFLPAYISG